MRQSYLGINVINLWKLMFVLIVAKNFHTKVGLMWRETRIEVYPKLNSFAQRNTNLIFWALKIISRKTNLNDNNSIIKAPIIYHYNAIDAVILCDS
jgi:hypothetical protein